MFSEPCAVFFHLQIANHTTNQTSSRKYSLFASETYFYIGR